MLITFITLYLKYFTTFKWNVEILPLPPYIVIVVCISPINTENSVIIFVLNHHMYFKDFKRRKLLYYYIYPVIYQICCFSCTFELPTFPLISFPFTWKTSFRIYFRAILLATNYLSFPSYMNVFIFLLLLNNLFAECGILCWQVVEECHRKDVTIKWLVSWTWERRV